MKPLYESGLNEFAKIPQSVTGLQFPIFIDETPRTTGHNGLRIKFRGKGQTNDSTTWPSIYKATKDSGFEIVGKAAEKTPAKHIDQLKSWIEVNYKYLNSLATTNQLVSKKEVWSKLKKFEKVPKDSLNEAMEFDLAKYKKHLLYGFNLLGKVAGLPVNVIVFEECPKSLKPVILVQDNFDNILLKKDIFTRTVPISVEKNPKLLKASNLPSKVIEQIKAWVSKNWKVIDRFWSDYNMYIDDFMNKVGIEY